MRITKEMLLKSAQDTVTLRLKTEKDLVAVYLVGSVLWDEPLIGGQADIDLIFVHAEDPPIPREIVRVYDEVHLDILHHPQSLYLQPRELRGDPWLGYSIQNHPQLLYDVRHWFEFTQASVGSQFHRPDLTVSRARKFYAQARTIWTDLHQSKKNHAEKVQSYLQALTWCGDAVACLNGSPLSDRRFSLDLEDRFAQIDEAEMYTGFNFLTGIHEVNSEDIQGMFPDWEKAYQLANLQENCPAIIHPFRKEYYLRAIQAILEERGPKEMVMPFLQTWNTAICTTLSTTPEYDAWLKAMNQFHLGKDDMTDRWNGLDHFLDRLDEALERWALLNGA